MHRYSGVDALAAVPLDEGIRSDIEKLLGYASALVLVVCVAKLIFVGARMAWDHKHNPGLESPTAAEFVAANVGALLATSVSVVLAAALLSGFGNSPIPPPTKKMIDQLEELPRNHGVDVTEDHPVGIDPDEIDQPQTDDLDAPDHTQDPNRDL